MRFASKYMELEKIKWSEVTQAQMLHVYPETELESSSLLAVVCPAMHMAVGGKAPVVMSCYDSCEGQ